MENSKETSPGLRWVSGTCYGRVSVYVLVRMGNQRRRSFVPGVSLALVDKPLSLQS